MNTQCVSLWRYPVGVAGIAIPVLLARLTSRWVSIRVTGEQLLLILLMWICGSVLWGVMWMLPGTGKNVAANHGGLGLAIALVLSWMALQDAKGGIVFALFLAIAGAIMGLLIGGFRTCFSDTEEPSDSQDDSAADDEERQDPPTTEEM
jgi:hypothetical protein